MERCVVGLILLTVSTSARTQLRDANVQKRVSNGTSAFDQEEATELRPSSAMLQVWANHSRSDLRRATQQSGASAQALSPPATKLRHKELLNQSAFWWLMGAVVLFVGLAVVRIEVDGSAESKPLLRESVVPHGEADHTNNLGRGATTGTTEALAADSGTTDVRWMLHLIMCGLALNVIQLCWGVLQELVTTSGFTDENGDTTAPDVQFIILCNRVSACIIAGVILKARRSTVFDELSSSFWPTMSNVAASWCQYRSLFFISFILQTTSKSAKLLPVLILDKLRGKRHTLLDFAEALVIFAGMTVFTVETEIGDIGSSKSTTAVGVGLLAASVLFDSLTPHLQDMAFMGSSTMDPLKMSFSMSFIATIMLLGSQAATGSLVANIALCWRLPSAMLQLGLLSVTSFLTQYLICYTIRTFGPVMFTLLASLRQILAVLVSVFLFGHTMTDLAVIAIVIIFGTILLRVLRRPGRPPAATARVRDPAGSSERHLSVGSLQQLGICAVAIHFLYCFYTLAQEFLATHTFAGHIFKFPVFIVAMNHTCGALFALFALQFSGIPFRAGSLPITVLPASFNFAATCCQHTALYFMLFPSQTMMKTLKVIPVMLVGRVMKNRQYTAFDYMEGALITILAAYFVWDFQFHLGTEQVVGTGEAASWFGVVLMVGYLFSDSFTSNLEDFAYQRATIDPGHLVFGMEAISALVAWAVLCWEGTFVPAATFLVSNRTTWFYVALLALASGSGAYACTATVRMFGPSVFTLLMTSRQIMSLVLSVWVFQHDLTWNNTLCLGVVAAGILTSSLRRVILDQHEREQPN